MKPKPLTLAQKIDLAAQLNNERALSRYYDADRLPESEAIQRCLARIHAEDMAYEQASLRKLRNWGITFLILAGLTFIAWAKFWPL